MAWEQSRGGDGGRHQGAWGPGRDCVLLSSSLPYPVGRLLFAATSHPILPLCRLRLLLAELAERLANGEQLYIHW